jgi:hypothetical protein
VTEVAELDIPCDVQGRDADDRLWAFLDEAAHPEVIVVGTLVVTGDEEAPVVARVVDIIDRPGGRKVLMALVGGADELAEALSRARVTAA